MVLLCSTWSSMKLLPHKCLIVHSNCRHLAAGLWMLLIIVSYLLWKLETMQGRQQSLNWKYLWIFLLDSHSHPYPWLWLSVLKSAWKSALSNRAERNCAQLCANAQGWWSRNNLCVCVCSEAAGRASRSSIDWAVDTAVLASCQKEYFI